MVKAGLLALALVFLAVVQAKKTYEGDKVIRVVPRSQAGVDKLVNIRERGQLDFWNQGIGLNIPTDIQVPLRSLRNFINEINTDGLEYSIHIDDVQKLIEENEALRAASRNENDFYSDYRPHNEIVQRLARRTLDCGERCSLFSIGTSFEGRELWVIRISGNSGGGDKRRVWIDSGIHAREWISHTTNLYFIDQLIDGYGSDARTTRLLDTYDFYHLVNMNPDGYQYSYDEERMWRGTRSVFPEFAGQNPDDCVGADANRNFDFMWMTIGASSDPCALTFAGFFPESEPEVQAVRDYVTPRGDQYDFFFTMHSYSQLFLLPYGYTEEIPDNYDNMMASAGEGAAAIEAVFGKVYRYDSASRILYVSSGTTRDWAAGKLGIPYVYTIELRPEFDSPFGFVLPPDQITPSGIETWEGVSAMIDYVITNELA